MQELSYKMAKVLGYGSKRGQKQDVIKQCIRILHLTLSALHHISIQLRIFLSIGSEVSVACDLYIQCHKAI